MSRKRKNDSDSPEPRKRVKLTTASDAGMANVSNSATSKTADLTQVSKTGGQDKDKASATDLNSDKPTSDSKRRRINKLVPPRPFPTVPTSVSATGPRPAHKEGKNYICLTRKTPLGAYMRRCKDVIIKDGCVWATSNSTPYSSSDRYKTLYLSAMGAAVPLLLQLSMALPPILPFSADEIRTEVITGTVEVQDEVLPEDEDEDITYQTRGKSTLRIIIKIGDGEYDGDRSRPTKTNGRKRLGKAGPPTKADRAPKEEAMSGEIVYQEPEQESMDML